ncbi:MAG TPA: hypothetical protein DCM86_03145 [Verrucomicrobiales bacterium]|nr:hypothetical protein [Verrucomicrobiales bacterium]
MQRAATHPRSPSGLRSPLRSLQRLLLAGCVSSAAALPLAGAGLTGVVELLQGEPFRGEILLGEGELTGRSPEGGTRQMPMAGVKSLRFQRLEIPPASPGPGEAPGFSASYYATSNFTGNATLQVDPEPRFSWGRKHPGSGSNAPFSARWEGSLVPLADGEHQFHLRASGTARLWISGELVASIREAGEPRESSGSVRLRAGARHETLLELIHGEGDAALSLDWAVPDQSMPRSPLPAGRVLHPATPAPRTNTLQGFLGSYYGTKEFTDLRVTRIDPSINFDWKDSGPIPGSGVGRIFSATWTARLNITETRAFQFGIEADGGVRLFVDGEKIFDRWEDLPRNAIPIETFPVTLSDGKPHSIRLDYFNEIGPSGLKFEILELARIRTVATSRVASPGEPADRSYPVPPSAGGGRVTGPTPAGVLLVDGSQLSRIPASASGSTLSFPAGSLLPQLPLEQVARIHLASPPAAIANQFDSQRGAGIWLQNGDFVEGEFRGLTPKEVRLVSVLFGIRSFDRDQVLAIALRPAAPRRSDEAWRITLKDGSTLRVRALEVHPTGIKLVAAPYDGLTLPPDQLFQVSHDE